MSTRYLSYGIVDGRTYSDRDLQQLRTVQLERAGERRARRTAAGRRRFLR